MEPTHDLERINKYECKRNVLLYMDLKLVTNDKKRLTIACN